MSKPEEIDCEGTDEIVCPYCGHKFSGSWEFFDGRDYQAEADCDECGKTFEVYRNFSIDYTSRKIEGQQ